jgi:hypothetical protein
MSRLRVKVYAPHVPASPVPRFAVRIAHALGDHADRTADVEASFTAAGADAAGMPLPWPVARFTSVAADELKDDPYGLQTYAKLAADEDRAFDVLFLPHPWKFYPAGRLTPTATPFVAYVPDLDFDDADLGSVTDACRLVMQSLARDCSAVAFPSAAVRDRAARRYGFAAGRAHVVAPARSLDAAPAEAADIGEKLGLPPGFVLFLEAGRPAAAEELRDALRAAGVDAPLVVLEGALPDDRWPAGGPAGDVGGAHRLSRLSTEEYEAVMSLAWAVVADTLSPTPFLDTPHLDALAMRKPLLCRAGTGAERWAGDEAKAAALYRGFDEAAGQLRRLRDEPAAFGEAAGRGEAQARGRSAEDAARELFDLFRTVHEAPARDRVRFRAEPAVSREKRVLWLINHGAVHSCEVALIRSLGYEVYSPKQLPKTDYRSLSVVHADDDRSTLPRWVLERLNRHNFYEDPLPEDVVDLLNGYFGTAIISVWGTMFVEAVNKFRGRILARAFGREHPVTYTQFWHHFGGAALWDRIRAIRHRFWLAAPYDSIGEWEPEPIRGCSLTLPLGIAGRVWRNEGKWTGGQAKVFFVCPSINLTPQYYGKIYRDFKYHFGDLPHLIAGNQETAVPDQNVTGKVPEGAFRRLLNELRVMYYHSREPRHLHYHPLEAIVHGMPVVYLTGGLMDYFGGPDQPGACATEADARRKVRRILDGDRGLIDAIRERQVKILETFTDASVRREWEEKFVGRVMATPVTPDVTPPARWVDPPSRAAPPAPPAPVGAGRARRIGIYLGPEPNRESVAYAAALAGAFATAEGATEEVEVLTDRRSVGGRAGAGTPRPRLRVELLRPNEYLPGVKIPKSQPNAVVAPDTAVAGVVPQVVCPGPASPAVTLRQRLRTKAKPMVQWLREARIVHRRRPVRTGAALVLAGLYYGRGVRAQRTLRPKGTGALSVLKNDYNAGPAPLTFEQIRRVAARNEVTVLIDPTDLLAADHPIDQLRELPLVVVSGDLAHESSAVDRGRGLARHREMRLWSEIARVVVFGSEHTRREAMRVYSLPFEKTAVIAAPPAPSWGGTATPERAEATRAKLGLPYGYVLAAGDMDANANLLALLEAVAVLKWRRGTAPALVIAGADGRRLLRGEGPAAYSAKVRQVIADARLVEGRDFVVLDQVAAEDLPGLFGGAAAYATVARFESQVHVTVLQAMTAMCPVVCSDVPANAERLGREDEYALLVPPDDPAALADALARVLDQPAEARARAERAAAWARRLDWAGVLDEYRRVLALAAGRSAGEAPVPAEAERRSAA